MSKNLKKLREARGVKLAELDSIRTAVGEGRMSAEQRTEFDAITAQLDELDSDIQREERAISLSAKQPRSATNPTTPTLDNPASPDVVQEGEAEARAAFVTHLRTGEAREVAINVQSGQHLIPTAMASSIEVALKSYGGVMSVADVFSTATGAPFNFPTCNDTANEAIIVAEGEEVDAGEFVMGNVRIDAFTFRTPLIPVSRELLQDSAFNLESFVSDLMTVRFARGFNKKLTTGTGVKEPLGVVTAAHEVSVEATDDQITYENLVDIMAELDAAYLTNAKWMLNSKTLAALKKIKDGAGQYIFQTAVATDVPATILGKPYVLNDQMDGIGAGKASILFGDFLKYKVRLVKSFEYMRLNEVLATRNAVGFLGFGRLDAKLIDAGTHPILKLVHQTTA